MDRKKILIVDDDILNLTKLISSLSKSTDNYKVLQATNGKIACSLLEEEKPDLVIMDWEMPVMNGLETLKFIKAQPELFEIPVIMATAFTASEKLAEAFECGAADYIKKPIDEVELLARVRSVLQLIDSYRKLKAQKCEIEEKSKKITASINYAKRIQQAALTPMQLISEILSEHFIVFMPKDIVSGDFYWIKKIENKVILIVADCTGHGVPGAFMSMLGISLLNEIVSKELLTTNEILNQLRIKIMASLRQTNNRYDPIDGMDMSVCLLDMENMKIEFAGANSSILIARYNPAFPANCEMIQMEGDNMPLGWHEKNESFSQKKYYLKEQDMLYLFTDGYISQLGGNETIKFSLKNFKNLIYSIFNQSMNEQRVVFEQTIITWMGNNQQVDDILIMGVRIESINTNTGKFLETQFH